MQFTDLTVGEAFIHPGWEHVEVPGRKAQGRVLFDHTEQTSTGELVVFYREPFYPNAGPYGFEASPGDLVEVVA